MACKTYDQYIEKGISERIFWDTFSDIKFWCENFKKEYSKKGVVINRQPLNSQKNILYE